MKIPKSPPDLKSIIPSIDPERFHELFFKLEDSQFNDKYLHWDELRRRKPPGEYSLNEWWFILKFNRKATYRATPLLDNSGQYFQYGMNDLIHEKLHMIDQKAGGRLGMSDNILNSPMKEHYYVSSLMQEAITSSQLEGATTTRQVAKELIRTGRTPRDKSEIMILNNYITMKHIHDLKDERMSPELLLEIHSLISKNTLDHVEQEGRFRNRKENIEVYYERSDIVVHVPPPAEELNDRIQRLCDFANGKDTKGFTHPIIQSIILHFWIGYVHPFVDGNGRTARALFYWSMLRNGYWLFEFLSISQILLNAPAKYGRAYLHTETDDNELNYFIIYNLDVIQKAIKELDKYIHTKTEQLRDAERNLAGMSELNHRQQGLIYHALSHPYQIYTIKSHSESNNCSKITARDDLLKLTEKGFLDKKKVSRQFIFTPAGNLEERLH